MGPSRWRPGLVDLASSLVLGAISWVAIVAFFGERRLTESGSVLGVLLACLYVCPFLAVALLLRGVVRLLAALFGAARGRP